MTKARTFYGVTAKETITLVHASTKPAELGERLAFVDKRIGDFRAKGLASKVAKWTKVRDVIITRINVLTGAAASQQPALAHAATFVDAPLPKAAKGRKGKAKAKAVGFDLDGLTDAQADAMFRQLAARIAARA